MNRADRLLRVAPGADPDLIAELAARPLAEVEAIAALVRQARRDALAEDADKRRARRDGRKRADEGERTGAVVRLIEATGHRAATSPEALAGLASFARAVNLVMGLAVDGLRRRGYSDAAIADCLGVTQQAVSKRYRRGDLAQPGL